jgi:predicted HicB family RNase H-like nuclease
MGKKMGRPPLHPEQAKGEYIQLRLSPAEREEYRLAAERAGMSLSEWIRGCLSRAARRGSKGS